MAAWMPSKAPRSNRRMLPTALPTSSAGVPMTSMVRPRSSATCAAAIPAPVAMAAMRLYPQACPILGRASYSAQIARWERTVACAHAKGGWEIANACLNRKTGIGEDLGDPAAGFLFGKAQFRVVVNAMAQIDQGLLIGVYGFLSLLLCVHECFPSRFVL